MEEGTTTGENSGKITTPISESARPMPTKISGILPVIRRFFKGMLFEEWISARNGNAPISIVRVTNLFSDRLGLPFWFECLLKKIKISLYFYQKIYNRGYVHYACVETRS